MGRPVRLWNRDFLLLWQGQLVSTLGDAVYRIALGFWILAQTGSTALMGAVMAATVLPRIVLSPLAGTLADRADRKWLLVASDGVAGVCVALLGVAALFDLIGVWMVFVVAVVIGSASALFDPTVLSAIPDLAPKRKLTQANSAFSMLATGAAIAGNAIGGFVYQAVGAALLFLFNGLSYLFSATSELFLRIPAVQRQGPEQAFLSDLREGLGFVWRERGLRALYLATAGINVFSTAVFVLLLPLYHQQPTLGAGAYGMLMASLSLGAFGGAFAGSAMAIPPAKRFAWFAALGLLQSCCLGALPWLPGPWLMLPIMALAGLAISLQEMLLTTALQLAVPDAMRGKAFGLRATVMLALATVAMAGAGALAELVSPALLISAAGAGMVVGMGLLCLPASVRQLFRTDRGEPSTA